MSTILRSNEAPSLDGKQWIVASAPLNDAQAFIRQHHYARGCSNTAVYSFGLYHRTEPGFLAGATLWLPPTRVAAESVDKEQWRKVLALSRMAVAPLVPRNACTFMLGKAVRSIRRERRFVALVTYADESQGHEGGVYRAAGWTYVGRTGPYPRWVDPSTGRQVATQATKTRKNSQMEALGYVCTGAFYKHKFVLRLTE